MATKLNSQQQGSFLLIGILFILINSLMSYLSFAYFSQLTVQHHSRQICRTEVLKTQRVIKYPLKTIMLLNPIVFALKNINNMSTIALFIPGLQGAALSVKMKAENWLTQISKLQQSLIKTIRTWTSARNFMTQNRLRAYLLKQKYSHKFNQTLRFNDVRLKMDSEFPAIRRKDPNQKFSEYRWASSFEEKQSITLTWKFKWTEVLTSQILQLLNSNSSKQLSSIFYLGCSATLNRVQELNLEAILYEDRSLSNVHFFF